MHFPDINKQNELQGPPKLIKVHLVIQHLSNKFQNLHLLNKNTADTSLTLWKGLSFRQYITLKAADFALQHTYLWLCLVFSHLHRTRHGTNKSICDWKQQNCSNGTKTVRKTSWLWTQCAWIIFIIHQSWLGLNFAC
jgi:hypothetical protein